MEELYYTPSIEDIRIGYECEEPTLDFSCHGCKPASWKKIVIGEGYNEDDLRDIKKINWPVARFLRTPYLTKEQIQAEGWLVKDTHWSGSNYSFEKGNIAGVQLKDKRIVFIMMDVLLDDYTYRTSNGQLYLGKCLSINEFRYICKLIGI